MKWDFAGLRRTPAGAQVSKVGVLNVSVAVSGVVVTSRVLVLRVYIWVSCFVFETPIPTRVPHNQHDGMN